MAREWFVFNLKPERKEDGRPYNKADLQALYYRVEDWIDTNKRKTSKLQLVSQNSGNGTTTWERLSDAFPAANLRVKFRSHRDAVLFKMFFSDYIWTPVPPLVVGDAKAGYTPVLLSLVRRVMPSIIARDLVGVSPMTGPTASIFGLRARYQDQQKKKPFAKDWSAMKSKLMDQLLENTRKALDE